MKYLWTAALLIAAAPATAQTIETGAGDWSNVPQLRTSGTVDSDMVSTISQLVDGGHCTIPGQQRGNLNLTVPFLVQFGRTGSVDRIVVRQLGCSTAEGLVADQVLRMLRRGSFASVDGTALEGWYRGQVGFAYATE